MFCNRSQGYVRGTGGNTYSLRIPGVKGFPDCGTEQVRDCRDRKYRERDCRDRKKNRNSAEVIR